MIRMGGVDALMLFNETPRAYMHTFKVAILDPSTDPDGWSFEKYYQDFSERIHLVPMFRWKCALSPLGLSHPMWVDDPDFNLAYHVRRVSCPPPGDHKALCEFMSSVYAYQLDRSRPLWMSWVVEGLEDGKIAIVTLVHHAYVDGVGAAWTMQQLYRTEPGWHPDSVPEWHPRPWPSWGKRLWWGARDLPKMLIKNVPRVVSGLIQKRKLDKLRALEGYPPHPNPNKMAQTPLNQALSYGRTFVCDTLPLDKFKTIGKGFGATINDVFLSCTAGAVRRLLQDMNYDPDQQPLIAGTPFAGTRPEGWQGLGNFTTADHCWLHSEIEDPIERLRASHEAAVEMKEHLKATREAGADLNALFQIFPPWAVKALRWYINRSAGKISLFGNMALSNVPGPREPIYLNKYKLDSWFSTGQVFDGTCLNMTMWSYCGSASLCILADQKVISDGWVLFNYFVEELDKLLALVPAQAPLEEPGSQPNSPVSS
jgi:diacylglycerol O-acyltransferase / wax synthase